MLFLFCIDSLHNRLSGREVYRCSTKFFQLPELTLALKPIRNAKDDFLCVMGEGSGNI